MNTTQSRSQTQSAARCRGAQPAYTLRAWWPSVQAYRDELRRAVLAIEERRQRRLRAA